MKVKPKLAYRHANYPKSTSVVAEAQSCVVATNQPDWENDAKIFVDCRGGAPEMLLTKDDYLVIVQDTGQYECHGDARVALLHKDDELVPVKFLCDMIICEATCHNSNSKVLVEIPID